MCCSTNKSPEALARKKPGIEFRRGQSGLVQPGFVRSGFVQSGFAGGPVETVYSLFVGAPVFACSFGLLPGLAGGGRFFAFASAAGFFAPAAFCCATFFLLKSFTMRATYARVS